MFDILLERKFDVEQNLCTEIDWGRVICRRRQLKIADFESLTVDQVEGEDMVDKIAALGFWPFFTSYVYNV